MRRTIEVLKEIIWCDFMIWSFLSLSSWSNGYRVIKCLFTQSMQYLSDWWGIIWWKSTSLLVNWKAICQESQSSFDSCVMKRFFLLCISRDVALLKTMTVRILSLLYWKWASENCWNSLLNTQLMEHLLRFSMLSNQSCHSPERALRLLGWWEWKHFIRMI